MEQIIDGLLQGTARPAATWIGPGNAEYDPNYQGLWLDPAKVKQELQQAGLPDGFKFLITFSASPVCPAPTRSSTAGIPVELSKPLIATLEGGGGTKLSPIALRFVFTPHSLTDTQCVPGAPGFSYSESP